MDEHEDCTICFKNKKDYVSCINGHKVCEACFAGLIVAPFTYILDFPNTWNNMTMTPTCPYCRVSMVDNIVDGFENVYSQVNKLAQSLLECRTPPIQRVVELPDSPPPPSARRRLVFDGMNNVQPTSPSILNQPGNVSSDADSDNEILEIGFEEEQALLEILANQEYYNRSEDEPVTPPRRQ